jgi:D-alanine-D-alanine ligase-like ATP-grasp enzyme
VAIRTLGAPERALVALLDAGGTRARRVFAGADLVRAMGPRGAWTRHRESRELRLDRHVQQGVYERIWRDAADAVGAHVDRLAPGVLEIRGRGHATVVRDHLTSMDDTAALARAVDKPLVQELLSGIGLPVSDQTTFTLADVGRAVEFMESSDDACVVKPAGGAGGSGVTTGVRGRSALVRAAIRASVAGDRLLIERQVPGTVHRILVLDGQPIGVLRRNPPRVVGDGRSTIRELIRRENERRIASEGWLGTSLLRVDLECVLTLRDRGLRLDTVLPAETITAVKSVTNQSGAADSETLPVGGCCEGLLDEARAAAGVVGLRLAGVDVVTTDVSVPLRAGGGRILEVNGNPGLHYHYLVANRDAAAPVAVPVLAALLAGVPAIVP